MAGTQFNDPRGMQCWSSWLGYIPRWYTGPKTYHLLSTNRAQCWKTLFILYYKQEAFEKCWAHSPLRAAVTLPFTRCRYCRTPAIAIAQAACDVHDDNAWQRGPLWPHVMGPTMLPLCQTVYCMNKSKMVVNNAAKATLNANKHESGFKPISYCIG